MTHFTVIIKAYPCKFWPPNFEVKSTSDCDMGGGFTTKPHRK